MPRYAVMLAAEATMYCVIHVDADNPEEADSKAYADRHNHEFELGDGSMDHRATTISIDEVQP